jgi:Domain of unknown function (DUF4202)
VPGDLNAAFAAIDGANAQDPSGKEQRDAELAVEWVRRLRDDAPEALLLAARAHHVRRWEIPRHTYPEGRAGYLKWKRDLQQHHADVVAPLLQAAGYDEAAVARVQDIVRKRGLAGSHPDPDVQTLEDALCIVFLQTQFADLAARLDDDKMVDILRKSLKKMSDEGRRAALALAPALSPDEQALLQAALER